MNLKLFKILTIICFCFNVKSQDLNCSIIRNNLKELNDTSLNLMFQKINSSKILLIGEYHGNKHSIIYPKLISKALSNGYNTIIIELPVSYNLLFEELLNGDEFSKITANLIARNVYNKKDFHKTLKEIYILNKTYPIKVICPDLEHSLIDAKDRLFDILSLHKKTLNNKFNDLYHKLDSISNKIVISEGACSILLKEIIELDNEGKYNDQTSLNKDFYLFKSIIKSMKLNEKITGVNYKTDERESFMTSTLCEYFKADTNMKAIGFFGSIHVQLIGDTLNNQFAPRNPFAKMLNGNELFKNRVSTIYISYKYEKDRFNYSQKYLFRSYVNCFDVSNLKAKKEYLFFIDKNNEVGNKLNNYSFILYL